MAEGFQMIVPPQPTVLCGSAPAEVRTGFFDYELPAHLIAQAPAVERDQARLLVLHRDSGRLSHHVFSELAERLDPGDLLILNDTKVMPARLVGHRDRTGGKWEGLFLRQHPDGLWELLCQTRGRLVAGDTLLVDPGPLQLELVRRATQGHWLARPNPPGSALELLQANGRVPLPPYIRKGRAGPADRSRYQTVFARQPGAVAAPTAGLHFTPRLFDRLEQRGIAWTFVTLHVGLGTFQPLRQADLAQQRLHCEWGSLPLDTVQAIARCRERGGRVVAVGTTSVRVLETVAASGALRPWSGETDLFIYPPYAFQVVDALVTNFHLPKTSLLLLVSAFAGASHLRQAYEAAIAGEYRFYSYGDAMLIL